MYIRYNPISEKVGIEFSIFEVVTKGENEFFIELMQKLKEIFHNYDETKK